MKYLVMTTVKTSIVGYSNFLGGKQDIGIKDEENGIVALMPVFDDYDKALKFADGAGVVPLEEAKK